MDELTTLKALLSDWETEYAHSMARGDWDSCTVAKARVAKIRNRIGKLIKARMALV